MDVSWWLFAVVLALGFVLVQTEGARLVERFTGRERRPGKPSSAYHVIYFGLTFAISLPPIWLLPDADPLVYCVFFFLGITVGGLAAQVTFGRQVA